MDVNTKAKHGVIFSREYFPEDERDPFRMSVLVWEGVEYEFTSYEAAAEYRTRKQNEITRDV